MAEILTEMVSECDNDKAVQTLLLLREAVRNGIGDGRRLSDERRYATAYVLTHFNKPGNPRTQELVNEIVVLMRLWGGAE